MAYLGNDLQVAFPSYRPIDSISASFNGVLNTFPLRVNGVTPVPFPVNAYQCLISVNNVVIAPDPSGATGFNLVGTNIVFATAPTGGHSFFGVILAGADYVTVGAQFPDGTVSAPSITFGSDSDTGFYSYGPNEIGVAVGGALAGTFKAGGITQTFAAGTEAAPSISFTSNSTTGFYSPGSGQIALSLNGTKKFSFDATSNGIFEGSVFIRSANSIRFYNTANTNYLSFKAAGALGTTVNWTLPSADGASGTYLSTNGTGTLSFSSLPAASTSVAGITQLIDSVSSTSTTTAATPNSVKTVYDAVVAGGSGLPLTGGTLTGDLTLNNQSSVRWADADSSNWVAFKSPAVVTGNVTWTLPSADGSSNQYLRTDGLGTLSFGSLPTSSTSVSGIVQLTDSISSTSIATAATPNSVKTAYDLANAALPKAGGALTGNLTLNAQSDLRFADSDSSNWVAFQAPGVIASNITWTLPATDGTSNQYMTTNGTGTLSWTSLPVGSTSLSGILQLTNSISSTSTTTAATPSAVKTAYDLAAAALPATGGNINGNITLQGTSSLRLADSDSSNWVAFQSPSVVASNVTWTLPATDGSNGQLLSTNGTGTLSWVSAGNVNTGSNNAFTGANTFYNATGQTFGTATSTQDGIVIQGRAGGTTSLRATFVPGTLTTNRTITVPDVTGTLVVTGSTGTVSNTMLASSSLTVNGISISLGGSGTVTSNTTNNLTINNSGSGSGSGSTFNGSTPITISYNSIGAPGLSGSNTFTGLNTFSLATTFGSNITLNTQSDLRFADADSSNWVALQAPATVASNVTWTLPAADGTSNQAIVTDGSGILSFASLLTGGNIQTFTSGGTYTPTAGKSCFIVIATGAGGGGGQSSTGGSGTSTTFTVTGTGSSLTSNGGGGGGTNNQTGGSSGSATGGQLNISGGTGFTATNADGGGAASFWGSQGAYGSGGGAGFRSSSAQGSGGAGGTAIRVYNSTQLGSTASVSIGTGGSAGGANATAGTNGVVFILEF